MSALFASLMGPYFDLADVAPIPGLTMVSIGRTAISTMTSPYLAIPPNNRDKRECMYTIHFKIKLIPKAEEDTVVREPANTNARDAPNSLALVFFSNGPGDTFAVVYPQSLLRTLQQCSSRRMALFAARSVYTVFPESALRTPRFAFSAIETAPSVRPFAENFLVFNKLPPELRVMVWREGLIDKGSTRVIQIWHDRKEKRIRSDVRVPIVLQVCRESRRVGLLEYQHVFNIGPSSCGVYANLKHDWIYLSAGSGIWEEVGRHQPFSLGRFLDAVEKKEREAIQHLMIDFALIFHLDVRNVRRLKSLKQIAMVALAPDCLGHILGGLPLGRRQMEDTWRRYYKFARKSVKRFIYECYLQHKISCGKWQPPIITQLYLHTLQHVNTMAMRGFIPVRRV